MSTKLDHIPELIGKVSWLKGMQSTLKRLESWGHVSEAADIMNPIEYAVTRPLVTRTSDSDAKVMEILEHRLSTVIRTTLPHSPLPNSVPVISRSTSSISQSASIVWSDPVPDTEATARDHWLAVCKAYYGLDVSSRILLRRHLAKLEMSGLSGVVPVVFLGYPDGVKGYLVRDVETRRYFDTHDLTYDQNLPSTPPIPGSSAFSNLHPPCLVPVLPEPLNSFRLVTMSAMIEFPHRLARLFTMNLTRHRDIFLTSVNVVRPGLTPHQVQTVAAHLATPLETPDPLRADEFRHSGVQWLAG
jgi:hypothetical protein